MGKYRRKQTPDVEAVLWTGTNLMYVTRFVRAAGGPTPYERVVGQRRGALAFWCQKANAIVTITIGDWIIREQDGDGVYPCTAEVFAATYEVAT